MQLPSLITEHKGVAIGVIAIGAIALFLYWRGGSKSGDSGQLPTVVYGSTPQSQAISAQQQVANAQTQASYSLGIAQVKAALEAALSSDQLNMTYLNDQLALGTAALTSQTAIAQSQIAGSIQMNQSNNDTAAAIAKLQTDRDVSVSTINANRDVTINQQNTDAAMQIDATDAAAAVTIETQRANAAVAITQAQADIYGRAIDASVAINAQNNATANHALDVSHDLNALALNEIGWGDYGHGADAVAALATIYGRDSIGVAAEAQQAVSDQADASMWSSIAGFGSNLIGGLL